MRQCTSRTHHPADNLTAIDHPSRLYSHPGRDRDTAGDVCASVNIGTQVTGRDGTDAADDRVGHEGRRRGNGLVAEQGAAAEAPARVPQQAPSNREDV